MEGGIPRSLGRAWAAPLSHGLSPRAHGKTAPLSSDFLLLWGSPAPPGFGLWSGLLGCWVIGFGPVSSRGRGVPAPPAGPLPEADCPPWSNVWPWLISRPSVRARARWRTADGARRVGGLARSAVVFVPARGGNHPWLGRGARVFARFGSWGWAGTSSTWIWISGFLLLPGRAAGWGVNP